MRTTTPASQSSRCFKKTSTLSLTLISSAISSCEKIQPRADEHHNSPVDRPLRIARHITAGQDVDSLQEEDQAWKKKQDAENVQYRFHGWIILSPLFDGMPASVSPSGLDASAFRGTI